MNGAGRARRRPPVTAAGGGRVLEGAGSAAPLCWRKVDAARGQAAGKPRCQVASERPLASSGSLGAAAPPPAALLIGSSRLHSPQPPPRARGLVTMASFSRPRHDSRAERGRAVGLGGLSSTGLAVNGAVLTLPQCIS